MSAPSATGSVPPSVQTMFVEELDVVAELRWDALKDRLQDKSLSHGSIELYTKCPNITAIEFVDLNLCDSLLRVDLSGCPKLESIPKVTFGQCIHIVSVLFGEHSNITNLGVGAFGDCRALASITLPDKLTVIEKIVFIKCFALERVIWNKNLRTIDLHAF